MALEEVRMLFFLIKFTIRNNVISGFIHQVIIKVSGWISVMCEWILNLLVHVTMCKLVSLVVCLNPRDKIWPWSSRYPEFCHWSYFADKYSSLMQNLIKMMCFSETSAAVRVCFFAILLTQFKMPLNRWVISVPSVVGVWFLGPLLLTRTTFNLSMD